MVENRTRGGAVALRRSQQRGDAFLEDTRGGRPPWLARERERYLADTEVLIEAMRRAVREPPKGDIEPSYFSGATPWLVPEPKPIRRPSEKGRD